MLIDSWLDPDELNVDMDVVIFVVLYPVVEDVAVLEDPKVVVTDGRSKHEQALDIRCGEGVSIAKTASATGKYA